MVFPFPDKIYADVTCISPEALASMGIRGLLLDIDGTLARTREPEMSAEVSAWIDMLRQQGIKMFVLSNNKREGRARDFGQKIGAPWRHKSGKPAKEAFLSAAQELGLAPERIAVVGDQIFTDVLGARRAGMKALMVQSTDTYLWYFPLRRLAELPFRRERKK